LIIKLNLSSDIPIYQQLKERIIEGIANGELQPNEELPSVRRLASDLSINLHTVNKTYTQLKNDGFISIHRSRGAVINPPECYLADESYKRMLEESMRPIVAESMCRGLDFDEFIKHCKNIYSSLGDEKNET
jgi:DNA-binding transcriptional regulator YhcF (GntR family)